eukprot:PhM_4_TR18781/c1_g3_i1/m.21438
MTVFIFEKKSWNQFLYFITPIVIAPSFFFDKTHATALQKWPFNALSKPCGLPPIRDIIGARTEIDPISSSNSLRERAVEHHGQKLQHRQSHSSEEGELRTGSLLHFAWPTNLRHYHLRCDAVFTCARETLAPTTFTLCLAFY